MPYDWEGNRRAGHASRTYVVYSPKRSQWSTKGDEHPVLRSASGMFGFTFSLYTHAAMRHRSHESSLCAGLHLRLGYQRAVNRCSCRSTKMHVAFSFLRHRVASLPAAHRLSSCRARFVNALGRNLRSPIPLNLLSTFLCICYVYVPSDPDVGINAACRETLVVLLTQATLRLLPNKTANNNNNNNKNNNNNHLTYRAPECRKTSAESVSLDCKSHCFKTANIRNFIRN